MLSPYAVMFMVQAWVKVAKEERARFDKLVHAMPLFESLELLRERMDKRGFTVRPEKIKPAAGDIAQTIKPGDDDIVQVFRYPKPKPNTSWALLQSVLLIENVAPIAMCFEPEEEGAGEVYSMLKQKGDARYGPYLRELVNAIEPEVTALPKLLSGIFAMHDESRIEKRAVPNVALLDGVEKAAGSLMSNIRKEGGKSISGNPLFQKVMEKAKLTLAEALSGRAEKNHNDFMLGKKFFETQAELLLLATSLRYFGKEFIASLREDDLKKLELFMSLKDKRDKKEKSLPAKFIVPVTRTETRLQAEIITIDYKIRDMLFPTAKQSLHEQALAPVEPSTASDDDVRAYLDARYPIRQKEERTVLQDSELMQKRFPHLFNQVVLAKRLPTALKDRNKELKRLEKQLNGLGIPSSFYSQMVNAGETDAEEIMRAYLRSQQPAAPVEANPEITGEITSEGHKRRFRKPKALEQGAKDKKAVTIELINRVFNDLVYARYGSNVGSLPREDEDLIARNNAKICAFVKEYLEYLSLNPGDRGVFCQNGLTGCKFRERRKSLAEIKSGEWRFFSLQDASSRIVIAVRAMENSISLQIVERSHKDYAKKLFLLDDQKISQLVTIDANVDGLKSIPRRPGGQ